MALDYSKRKQVSRNRPKRRPIGRYILLALVGVSSIYGLGIATGWLMFGRSGKPVAPTAAPSQPATAARQAAGTSKAGPAAIPAAPGAAVEGTDLTFFKTLPRGEQNLMGSGMNPAHELKSAPTANAAAQAVPADRPAPVAQKADKTQPQSASPDKQKSKPATEVKSSPTAGKTTEPKPAAREKDAYAVQVASYQDRQEAEGLKATLEKKGFAVRISETKVQGKGVRYRVRVGKGLGQEGASQLATKLGGKAMVVPE